MLLFAKLIGIDGYVIEFGEECVERGEKVVVAVFVVDLKAVHRPWKVVVVERGHLVII